MEPGTFTGGRADIQPTPDEGQALREAHRPGARRAGRDIEAGPVVEHGDGEAVDLKVERHTEGLRRAVPQRVGHRLLDHTHHQQPLALGRQG